MRAGAPFRGIGTAVLAVAIASGATALSPHDARAQFDGPEADVVRVRETAFARTMADRDFDAFLTFIAPDAVFFAGNEPLRGREAIGAAWRPFFDGEAAPFSWLPDLVQVIDGGELALSSGPVTSADGQAAGRFNSVWRKATDGQWYVVFDKGS